MKIGIFPGDRAFALYALAEGATALGWGVHVGKVQKAPRNGDFDLVVVGGAPWKFRGMNGELCRHYAEIGVPWVNVENGWLYSPRKPPHFFTYVNKFPWCPPFECPSDRREKLNMTADFKPRGEEILIAGQGRQFDEPMQQALARLRHFTKRKIVYRPRRRVNHPKWVAMKGYAIDMERTAAEALDAAWCVITHHSNMGGEALMRGIPAHCSSDASFARFGRWPLRKIDKIKPPSERDVNDWLSRMAYALWSVEEFRSGAALGWIQEKCL